MKVQSRWVQCSRGLQFFFAGLALYMAQESPVLMKYRMMRSDIDAYCDLCQHAGFIPIEVDRAYREYNDEVGPIEEALQVFLAWSSMPLTRDLNLATYPQAASRDGRHVHVQARRAFVASESKLLGHVFGQGESSSAILRQIEFDRLCARSSASNIPNLRESLSIVDDGALSDEKMQFPFDQWEREAGIALKRLEEIETSDRWIEREALAAEGRGPELYEVFHEMLEAKAAVYRAAFKWSDRLMQAAGRVRGAEIQKFLDESLYGEIGGLDRLSPRLESMIARGGGEMRIVLYRELLERWRGASGPLLTEMRALYRARFDESVVHEDARSLTAARFGTDDAGPASAHLVFVEAMKVFTAMQREYENELAEIQ